VHNLDCRVGALDLTLSFLAFDDTRAWDPEVDPGPHHLFIVSVRANLATLFVGSTRGHASLASMNAISEENVKGGGFCYIDAQQRLTLAGTSDSFGAIPQSLAARFVALLAQELQARSISFSGTRAEPATERLNECWKT